MTTGSVPHEHPRALLDCYNATYTEVFSLAKFLCEEENMALSVAMRIAAEDLGYCLLYAARWDDQAFDLGNDDAAPF